MGRDGTARELVVRDGRGPSWRPNFTAPPIVDSDPPLATGPEIAYVAATDAGYDLFTVRPDGTQVRQLTTSGGAFAPAWSPDHSKIAYGKKNGYDAALWVMDVLSGERERVGRIGGYSVAWSPDGHRLVWGNWYKLVIYDLRTRERTRLPFRRNITPGHPTWSPDGRRIAFSELGDILVVSARGGPFRHVTRLRGYETDPDWSPSGKRILFSRQRGTPWHPKTEILSVRPDGTGLRPVANTSELDYTPSWSPDGRRMAYYSDGPHPFAAAPAPGLWTVGRNGGGEWQLVLRDRTITYVDW
jgi:TolB protein